METCDLLEKWRDGVKNDLVHLSENQRGQEARGRRVLSYIGYVHVGMSVLLSVIWRRNQIREIGRRIGYHFPGN